ncbi:hypothetical protein C8R43DRAFT_953611 [Mycena crocata]|nr:hypothetical protein C8R43DRAFT_953611 [Mycena crocata]
MWCGEVFLIKGMQHGSDMHRRNASHYKNPTDQGRPSAESIACKEPTKKAGVTRLTREDEPQRAPAQMPRRSDYGSATRDADTADETCGIRDGGLDAVELGGGLAKTKRVSGDRKGVCMAGVLVWADEEAKLIVESSLDAFGSAAGLCGEFNTKMCGRLTAHHKSSAALVSVDLFLEKLRQNVFKMQLKTRTYLTCEPARGITLCRVFSSESQLVH